MTADDAIAKVGIRWSYSDGGRAAAGYRGEAGDCVARAIAIAAEMDYSEVYALIAAANAAHGRQRSARNGVPKPVVRSVLCDLGWEWTPTMHIGQGCTVHLRHGELPEGRLVVSVTKHITAVVDGVVFDTHDPGRRGTRCVYGFWQRL